jgi:hypothetical protein
MARSAFVNQISCSMLILPVILIFQLSFRSYNGKRYDMRGLLERTVVSALKKTVDISARFSQQLI